MLVPTLEFSKPREFGCPRGRGILADMRLVFLFLGAAVAWGQQPADPADPVVITVGSETITKSQFEEIVSTLSDQQRAQAQTPAGKRQIAERLAELKILAREARERKMDQTAKIQAQLKLQIDQFLANALFQELGNSTKPDEAELRAYYELHKQDWNEVKARHILIRMQGSKVPLKPGEKDLTDAEALAKVNDLRAKLVAGADFSTLAKAESDDAGSGQNGGDLGPFKKGQMVPEFEKAAFVQEIGKVGEPVKTQFGYHLILVDSRTNKSFEDVRAEIEQKMKPEIAQKSLNVILKKASPVYNDAYFGK
jgi:parvulin-like peptidyl-prolyl isomerase